MVKRSNNYSGEGPSCIEVLRNQEMSKYYQCQDYLSGKECTVTADTRSEMLTWVCKVTSFMKFSDDIPILTTTLLDRFLQTLHGQQVLRSVPEFRLATMGCLYLTAKVHDHTSVVMSSESMSALSQGMFSVEDVEEMELLILSSLGWHANPPTALDFVSEFLALLPCSVTNSMRDQAYDLCQKQIQHSILNYEVFALTESSTIAFFAVQNALKRLGMDSILLGHVGAIFSYASHTDYYSHFDTTEEEEALQECLMPTPPAASRPSKKQRRHSGRSKKGGRHRSTPPSSTSSNSNKWTERRSVSFDNSPCGVASFESQRRHRVM